MRLRSTRIVRKLGLSNDTIRKRYTKEVIEGRKIRKTKFIAKDPALKVNKMSRTAMKNKRRSQFINRLPQSLRKNFCPKGIELG